MKKDINSYTAADAFPQKLLFNKVIDDGKILPIHVQLNPTNICNLNCPFCSCASRKKTESIDFDNIITMMRDFMHLGCKSVTITGGGDPLLYPEINELFSVLNSIGIKIGLVTNGTLFHKLQPESYKYITWCRISASDHRKYNTNYFDDLYKIVNEHSNVDWAFSYVATKDTNYSNMLNIIKFANNNKFTHVRVVSDLLHLDDVFDMVVLKNNLKDKGLDNDDIVIYQGRKEFIKGTEKCLISLLKPLIGADGKIYPCCGTQYAHEDPALDYHESMCMGDFTDIKEIYKEQKYFNGEKCYRCYYSNYNNILDLMTGSIEHKEFV